jgi:hypothetical protein
MNAYLEGNYPCSHSQGQSHSLFICLLTFLGGELVISISVNQSYHSFFKTGTTTSYPFLEFCSVGFLKVKINLICRKFLIKQNLRIFHLLCIDEV